MQPLQYDGGLTLFIGGSSLQSNEQFMGRYLQEEGRGGVLLASYSQLDACPPLVTAIAAGSDPVPLLTTQAERGLVVRVLCGRDRDL